LFLNKILVKIKKLKIKVYRSQMTNNVQNHLVSCIKTQFPLIVTILTNGLLLSFVQDLIVPAMLVKHSLAVPLSGFRSVH
jgi:hypothetical protein